MELIDDSPKMELIDDSIPSSSKKEEPSKTSIIDTVKKAVTTPLSHIKQATDVALPAAENLTSQVLGIGGFAASVPVAVRDYMQALFESGGDWDKAYEAGSKGVQEVNDIVGSWKPRTELGKKSIEYSNKVVSGIMEPIASTVGKEAAHQAQSWGAPEGIQKTLKAVGETATEAEIFRRSLKGRVPSKGEVLDTIDATLGRGEKAPIIQEVPEGNKWRTTRRPGQQAMEERLKDIQPEEVFEPVTIRPNNVVSPKRKMEIIDDSSISNKEVPIDNTLSSKIEQRPYVSGDTFSYRGKPYIVESIDGETGRIKAFGREKTIDPARVKDQGASPHPIDEVRKTYDTLYRAGYQESELMHMPFEEMKRLVSERDSSMKRTPTLEEINRQKAITDSILEGQRAKDIADIQLLKEYGYDEGRISEMHDRDIKRTANDIRDYIRDKETGTSKADRAEASIDEFDTILETLKDKKVEDYTPEDMELIRKALGDTEGYVDDSSVKGLGEEYREFLRQQETGMTDADIEAWENASTNKAVEQAASLGDKVALEVKGKREVSTYGERLDLIKEENKRLIQEGKVKTHRPGKRRPVEEQSLEELMEGDGELPPEELDFMMSSKVYDDLPSYLRDPNTAIGPIERMIERSRQAASELYTHIAQGLASENISIRNQAERGQAFLQGKMDFIDTMREVAQDKPWTTVESMNSLVRGYRYLPSMFDKTLSKESFIKSIRKLEEKAGVDEKVHRTGPNVHEAIDDYFKKGDISSTEATWLHAVVDALRGKAKFDLLLGDRLLKNKKANGRFYDKEGNQVALGYYDFVNNILAIKDKASFLHEVSHFAFYNVLSSADRINFLKSLTEQFYKDGKLDRSALRDHLETDHFYEMINPSEIFAKEMQNYVLQKAKSSWVKDTYEKVKSFVRSMIGEAERSGAIPIERRAIYDSVLFDMKAGETGRLGRRYIPGRVIEGYGEISPRTVWHGTGKFFEKFKDAFIGSGEGAQTFGVGHYFTGKKEVAEWYAKKIGSRNEYKVLHEVDLPEELNLLDLDSTPTVKQLLPIVKELEKLEPSKIKDDILDDIYLSQKNFEGSTLSNDVVDSITGKKLFDSGTILDKEKLDLIRSNGIEVVNTVEYGRTVISEITGKEIQYGLQKLLGKWGASKFLMDCGFQGNTYIGGTSGARNYVIFDENIPKIKNTTTLDFMGLQQIYEGAINAYKALRSKEQNPIVKICEQIGRGKEETNRIKLGMPDKKNGGTKVEPFSDDIWIGTQWNPLRQPLGEMRLDGKKQRFLKGWADGTPVEGTVYEANKGQNAASFYHNNNVIGLRETQMFLKRNGISNEDLTAYMRGEYTGKVSQAMLEGAGKVRDWLDYMRDRYRDFLKGEYARHLKNKELGALNDLINGKNLLEVSKRWRIKNLDVIKDIYDDYKKLENWGLDDYLPKVELGSYRIVTPEGTVVGVALSRKHAVQKIMEIIDEYPEYKGDFYIDNTPRSAMFENLTGVGSTKAYYSIVHKLAKAIQEETVGIDSAIAEKMAQRSVKKQFSIKPVDKYSEFTKVREDYLRGEKDIFPVLAKYSRVMELKMALDPVIHEYKKNVRDKLSLAPNLREATDRLLEDAKGKYWKIDQAIDFLLKKPYEYLEKKGVDVGPAPIMSFSRWTGRARAFEANVKLGYRPVNSVVNFVSGQGHVWTKTGTEYIGKAWKLRNSAEGKALLDELGPYMGMAFAEEGVGTGAFSIRKAGETKIGAAMKPLGAFQAAEIPNREIGILANYLMGKEKFGLSESAAKEFAIRSNWFQNFSYNIANLPASMRGPLGKTVGQFKTYMFKEMSFIASLTPQELARYSTMQLMLGGPRALMYVIKSLPIVAIVNSAEDIERWLNTNYPRVSRGIPGFFGTDISAMSSFQLPTEPSELVGPLFSDIWNMYKTFAVPVMNGTQNVQQTATLDNVNSLLMDNVPFWRNWNDVWKNGLTGDGNIKDVKTGKILTDNPLWLNTDDYMKKVLSTSIYSTKRVIGAQDLEVSATRLEESLDKREEKRLSEALLIVNRQIAEIVAEGKPVPQYLWDRKTELMLKGKDMTMRGLEQTLENQVLPPTVRRLRRKNQIQKADVLEHAPDFD